MHHPTSDWATRYGLPDPGIASDGLLHLVPAELTRRFQAVSVLADHIDGCCDSLRVGLVPLAAGWSSTAALSAAGGLLAAAQTGSGVLRLDVVAAMRAAETLEYARAAATEAYEDADAAIARGGLLRSDVGDAWPAQLDHDVAPDGALRRGRCAVVDVLGARIGEAQTIAHAAVRTLREALAGDPRQGLATLHARSGPLPTASPDATTRDDLHNRAALATDLSSGDPVRARFAATVAQALDRAGKATVPGTTVQLLVYDPLHPAGQGGAAIAIGDVSAADNVAVVVPGVGNSPSAMSGVVDAIARLRTEAAAADPQATVAAVAWLDYDLPLSWAHDFPMTPTGALADSLIAADGTDALSGGTRLAAFTDRIRAEAAPSTHLTLIGHSYGSVVVSQAALRSDAIDDVVMLAAPGAGPGVHDSSDYHVAPDHVFALSFEDDPVASPITDLLTAVLVPAIARPPGSTFGPDPAAAGFGAQVIDAPSNVPTIQIGGAAALPGGLPQAAVVDVLTSVDQHPLTNYLTGAAGLAVGAVVVGRYTAVRTKPRR